MNKKEQQFILWFDQISKEDIPLVGGKNANLGELYRHLTKTSSPLFPAERIQVPYGFAITAYAYRYFLEKNNLTTKIQDELKTSTRKILNN